MPIFLRSEPVYFKRILLDKFRTKVTEEVINWCELHSAREQKLKTIEEALQISITLPEPTNMGKDGGLSYYIPQDRLDIRTVLNAICESEEKELIKQTNLKVMMRVSADLEVKLQKMLKFNDMNKMMKLIGIIENVRRVREGVLNSVKMHFCTFGVATKEDHTSLGLKAGDLYVLVENKLVDVRIYKQKMKDLGLNCDVPSKRNTKKRDGRMRREREIREREEEIRRKEKEERELREKKEEKEERRERGEKEEIREREKERKKKRERRERREERREERRGERKSEEREREEEEERREKRERRRERREREERREKKCLISLDDWRAVCCIAISVEFESNFAINNRLKALLYITGMCNYSVLEVDESKFGSDMGDDSDDCEMALKYMWTT